MSLKFRKAMANMKKKLGFTLIEMLAVIAIIAILVSIIVPTTISYTNKANAATNAANLRAMKATLSTMLVSGRIDYSSAEDTEIQIQEIVAEQKLVEEGSRDWWELEFQRYALRTVVITNERTKNTYYAKNGKMDVDGEILNAPQSKAIKAIGEKQGLNLREGTDMRATVGKNEIILTYGGIPLEVFARIAEQGDDAEIDMSKEAHSFIDSNGDGVCDLCKGSYVHGRGEEEVGSMWDKELGNIHTCTSADDHYCDDPTCGLRIEAHKDDGSGTCGYTDCNEKIEDDSCVTSDTLVSLANGSKKRMAEVTNSDYLMVWDFFNGQYAAVPASVLVFHGNNYYDVCTLVFEDGTKVETIGGHDFFDFNLNEFVTIDEFNASSYVGHSFAKASGSSYKAVKLVDYIVENKYTGSYSLISAMHNNFIVEDMISLTPLTLIDTDNFFEYFEVGAGMKYDEAKMQADIETYGLYTYEDFADYLTYEQYVALNAPYYKVLVGKGYVTFADLLTAISAYVN